MKIKQLLCLGALMTLPMSMSADDNLNDISNAYKTELEQRYIQHPMIPVCKNIVHVTPPERFHPAPDKVINSHMTKAVGRLLDRPIQVQADYEPDEQNPLVHRITFTFIDVPCGELSHPALRESLYEVYNTLHGHPIITLGTPSILLHQEYVYGGIETI